MPTGELRQQLPVINTKLEEAATGAIYQVIKEFNSRLEDELSLRIGDKIEVISDDKEYNDGWYMGKSLSTGAVGLYPKAFTQLIPSLSRPTLLRSRSRRIASPSSTTQSPMSAKSNSNTPVLNKAATFEDSRMKSSPATNEEGNLSAIGQSTMQNGDNTMDSFDSKQQNTVSKAMSDIDKALEELRSEAGGNDTNKFDNIPSTSSKESLNPESVESWSPEQVSSYFSYLGFDQQSSEQFAKHKITGAILLELELAYLKELDISSFGTRFEIFKEIEALKELANEKRIAAQNELNEADEDDYMDAHNMNQQSLQAPPELYRNGVHQNSGIEGDLDSFTRPLGHARKKSRSLDDIPETTKAQSQQQQFSTPLSSSQQRPRFSNLNLQPPSSQLPEVPKSAIESQFVSPRRAPLPPSYPSPIQLRDDNGFNSTPTNNRNSYYEGQSNSHSRKPSYDINPAYQSQNKLASHSRKSSMDYNGFYSHSRSGSRGLKSASVADLLSSRNVDNGRPASSIYMDPTHSRTSSVGFNRGHTRRSSEASVIKPTSKEVKEHRRHSSVFSFLSTSNNNFTAGGRSVSPSRKSRPASMIQTLDPQQSPSKTRFSQKTPILDQTPKLSPTKERRSVSAKDPVNQGPKSPVSPAKRSVSEAVRAKTLRSISSSNTKKMTKNNTSAFMEGIKSVKPSESIKTSQCYGWMAKRGGIAVGVWKQRYFVLHGTRLSYYTSLSDTRERGLIDITSHKVLPAKEDDRLVSLYAAGTGNGKFCFKLVPPAPGSRKGLTFTQPKVHYFAVETKEEMRAWMAALIKATIDIDESVPVLSSCATPTVTLQKAQSLLQQARETAKTREEERSRALLHGSDFVDGQPKPSLMTDFSGNSSNVSPDSDSFDSNLHQQSPNTTATTSDMTPVMKNRDSKGFSPFNVTVNNSTTFTPKSNPSSAAQSPVDDGFRSKPYSAGALRHPSQRVTSASQAAAQAALGFKKTYDGDSTNPGSNHNSHNGRI